MKKWRRVWRCVLSMRAILLSTGKVLSLNDDGGNLDCEVDSSISWEWNDSLDKISDFEEKLYWCPAGTAILKVSFQVHQALRTITATTVNSVQDLRHQIKVKERNLKQKANREKGISSHKNIEAAERQSQYQRSNVDQEFKQKQKH